MASCFSCIPPPASVQPRKIYNILVPDVFPLKPPPLDEPLSPAIKRKFGKLGEYLQQNPSKCGKVSRRLTRAIKKALYDHKYGNIRIAVGAYTHLLSRSTDDESKFNFNYFSTELINQPDTVIKTLLNHHAPLVQALGADLLASYINAQDEVEHQAPANEALIGDILKVASKELSGSESKDACSVRVSCLRGLKEYLLLCQKLKVLPRSLADIQGCCLANIQVDGRGYEALLQPVAFNPKLDTTEPPTQQQVSQLAMETLQLFKPFLQDIGSVYRVIETVFSYLDQKGRWEKADLVKTMITMIQNALGDQTYPLFTALIRHSSVPGLANQHRTVILQLAKSWGVVYSLSAFSLGLQELPRVLVAANSQADASQQALQDTVTELLQYLSCEVGDAGQLFEAISSSLRPITQTSAVGVATLQCCVTAAQAIPKFRDQGRSFPAKVLPAGLLPQLSAMASWGHADTSHLAQQLLHSLVPCLCDPIRDDRQAASLLSLVQALAQRPGSSPRDFVCLDRAVAACIGSRKPAVLAMAVQLCTGLYNAVGKNNTSTQPNLSCAALMLVDSSVLRLASAAECAPLRQHRLLGLERGAPALQLHENPAEGLVCKAEAFGDELAVAAKEVLGAVLQQYAAGRFPKLVVEALCKEGLLHQEYGVALPDMLDQPLAPAFSAMAASVAAQHSNGNGVPGQQATSSSQPGSGASSRRGALGKLQRDRRDLKRVMDILGEDGEADGAPGASGNTAATLARTGTAAGALHLDVSLQDVLNLVDALPDSRVVQPQDVQVAVLAGQLEPWVAAH